VISSSRTGTAATASRVRCRLSMPAC
jgi:hypothetical protein